MWDGQVAHQDPEIAALRTQFECVRVTQMNGQDLSRFNFDYDNTWQAFFLDADLNVYGRYGGRDATAPEARLSKESLLQTMREVLAAHERRLKSPQPAAGREEIHPAPKKPLRPTDFSLLKKHHTGCLHCHQVQEYRLLQSHADGDFDRRLLFPFPLPENLGLRFDRNHGHRVAEVMPDSPADRAGVRIGDVVVRSDNVPVRSEDDFRWTLHRQGEARELSVTVVRGDAVNQELPEATGNSGDFHSLRFELPAGWRRGDVSWRKSLRSYPVPWGFLAYPIGNEERKAAGFEKDCLSIKIVSLRGQAGGIAKSLGLQKGDVVIAVEENREPRTLEQFKSDLVGRYSPGDEMRVTVLRLGQAVELRGNFPDWFSSDRTVP